MKIPIRASAVVFAAALAAATLASAAHASPAPVPAPGASGNWHESLGHLAPDQVNLARGAGGVTIADPDVHPAAAGGDRGYGMEMLTPRTLAGPVDQVSVTIDGTVPAGASATVDVRTADTGGQWSSWQPASGTPATPTTPADQVQLRITLWSNASGAGPAVTGLDVSTRAATSARTVRPHAALSYRVYATREGLVGGTTANGHVITSNDHFVALPSGKNLSPKGSSQYSVQVCGPTRCETAPVWDVGPWNTNDDYWNPASVRSEFKDVAQGTPEAQAAYLNGYNGGKDEFGRKVLNPAGIDLADGTFYNVGLNDNGYVTVTYLWTGSGGGSSATGTVKTTSGAALNVRSGPHTTSTVVGSVASGSTVTITCQTPGDSVSGTYGTTTLWDKITSPVGYVSDAYVYTGSDQQVAPNC
ncbi:MAG TPA: SH3 domain-containing protein [Actinocatenispora sp.]